MFFGKNKRISHIGALKETAVLQIVCMQGYNRDYIQVTATKIKIQKHLCL